MILKTALRVFAVFLWALISTPTISLAQQSTPLDQVEQEAIKALILQAINKQISCLRVAQNSINSFGIFFKEVVRITKKLE